MNILWDVDVYRLFEQTAEHHEEQRKVAEHRRVNLTVFSVGLGEGEVINPESGEVLDRLKCYDDTAIEIDLEQVEIRGCSVDVALQPGETEFIEWRCRLSQYSNE